MSIIERDPTVEVEGTPQIPDVVVLPEETPIEAQILETAADILETEGWVRGTYSAWANGRCAVGGVGAAMQRLKFVPGKKAASRRAAEHALAELVRKSTPRANVRHPNEELANKSTIIRWNDSFANKQLVIQKMREAAARLTPKL